MDFPTFYGHAVWTFYGDNLLPSGLIPDMILALIPAFLLIILRVVVRKKGTIYAILTIAIGTAFLVFLPNTTYLMLEPKHLVLTDKIAETPDFGAYVGFGFIGALGLYLNAMIVLNATKGRALQTRILCFACACGATLGMNGLNSVDVYVHPVSTVLSTIRTLSDFKWIMFTAFLFLFLIGAMYLFDKLQMRVRSLL